MSSYRPNPKDLPFKNKKWKQKRPQTKNMKQILAQEKFHLLPVNVPTYENIEAAISIYPPKKYCDLTGFPAKYTDARSGLRYSNKSQYIFIRTMPQEFIDRLLQVRNAVVTLK
eukprot:GFYU01002177.1.p1 GENE.GFYU01002177.1~~GFYU01002177.1.p1  ORF type:complete len:124 (-),score=16.49 GFYU01002177.1:50-388(-)